jgi:hypothetical protein
MDAQLLLGGIREAVRKVVGIGDDGTKEMLVSFVLVAEGMVAGQPLLQGIETLLVSVGTWAIDIDVDVLTLAGALFLDGRGDQGLDIGDVRAQSDQGDDDAVTILGAVLEEDVGRELVDG